MRSLSSAARAAMYAPQTGATVLCLLTISGTGIPVPLRFTHNNVDIVSRGVTFLATAFTIILPDERDDAPPQVSLAIDNIDRNIVLALRSIAQAPTVVLEIVFASAADTVEAGPFNLSLRNVDYAADVVTGDLMFEDFLNESFPADTFTPSVCPGLYQTEAA